MMNPVRLGAGLPAACGGARHIIVAVGGTVCRTGDFERVT
jgi:hypothetical protein